MTDTGEYEETSELNPRNLDAAINLFHACDKDKDGYITRSDLESLLEELQLDESVDALLSQLGADSAGRISCTQFVKNAQLTAFTSGNTCSASGMDYSDGCMPSSSENSLDRHSGPSIWVSSETKPSSNHQRPLPPLPLEAKPPNGRSANLIHISNPMDTFAMSSLTSTIEELQLKLEEVTREKNHILYEKMKQEGQSRERVDRQDEMPPLQDESSRMKAQSGGEEGSMELQCQRYEERIVELHSVIAELTRKNELQRNGVILEESEDESLLTSNDDGLYEDEEEDDYTSLAFERALQDPKTGASSSGSSKFSSEVHLAAPDVDYSAELFALQSQLDETRIDNERLNELLDEREEKLALAEATLSNLTAERDRLKRQLDDIHCTVEYQEAKMDSQAKAVFRSSSERRSLRKKRHEKRIDTYGIKDKSSIPSKASSESISNSASNLTRSQYRRSIPDLEVEVEKLTSKIDHLRSQNNVLAISLDDSKNFTDRLGIILNKHESNNSAMSLALNYCDHIVESYDVLVALLETEIGILSASFEGSLPTSQQQHQLISGDLAFKRATSNRKSAEKVAKHLLARVLNRSDSGISETGGASHSQHTWDSSGYSQTASSTSTTSSLLNDSEFTKMDELKLRDHISQLKTIRASIQGSVVEVESPITEEFAQRKKKAAAEGGKSPRRLHRVSNLEHAVVQQELSANREERADLRAKIYLLVKEKSSVVMELEERSSREAMLRSHISHLQEELGELERDMGGHRGVHLMRHHHSRGGDSREESLKKRIDSLLASLDKVTKSNESRHKHSEALIGDLKRVNSTLSEALEKNKRKYLSRLKKLEHQLMMSSSSGGNLPANQRQPPHHQLSHS